MLYELLRFAEPDYGLLVAGFFFILLSRCDRDNHHGAWAGGVGVTE